MPIQNEALELEIVAQSFALHTPFRISRGTKTHADVVLVKITDTEGRNVCAECVPYARYGETVESTTETLRALGAQHASIEALLQSASHLRGAAANALLTAAFAWKNPEVCRNVLADFRALNHSQTLVIDTPELMAAKARLCATPIAKMKLSGDDLDLARVTAVHAARPDLPLWVDANEGLSAVQCEELLPQLCALGVVLVEQPCRAGDEPTWKDSNVALCADESFHGEDDVQRCRDLGYRYVNIKLDKAGGLLAAERAAHQAHRAKLGIVIGCMVSTSLSIAAGYVLYKRLREAGIPVPFVDLDGATFLAQDRSLDGTGWL